MARRRWQQGTVQLRRGVRSIVWVGRWREDVIAADGCVKRRCCKEVLGTRRELPTRKLALRELAKRLVPINSSDYRPLRNETFAEFVDWWTVHILATYKQSSQSSITSQMRTALLPFFGKAMLREIQYSTVQSFVTALQRKAAAPKTIKNYVLTLRMIWKTAKARACVNHNPFDGLILPRISKQRRSSFTAEEIRRILGAASEPYLTLYWLAAETGMRSGELCGLPIANLHLDRCQIEVTQSAWRSHIQEPKTDNAKRTLAISPQLADHLRRHLTTRAPNRLGLLFATAAGKPLAPCVIMRMNLHPLLDSLGLQRCGLHAFRHGNASLMDHLKVPMKTRQERLGHAPGSKITLSTYTHSLDDDDHAIADEIGNYLCPIAPKTAAMRNDLGAQGTMIQ